MNPWLGLALALGLLGSAFLLVVRLKARFGLPGEISRKLAHISAGLITLTFPLLFEAPWPVFLLTGLALAAMGALRRGLLGSSQAARVLHEVRRESFGDLLFPCAVATVFALAHGQAPLFVIPILILTLADSTGALIGTYYGRRPYRTEEGRKTLEGSLAIASVTWACVFCTLTLAEPESWLRALPTACLIALFVTLIEAIALKGFDNFFIPVLTYCLLVEYERGSPADLWLRLLLLSLLLGAIFLWRRRSYLNVPAAIAATLLLFSCGSFGGLDWLVPALLLLLGYLRLCRQEFQEGAASRHGLAGLTAACGPASVWLFLYQGTGREALIGPFLVSLAVELSLIRLAFLLRRHTDFSLHRHIFDAAGWVFLLFFPLFLFLPEAPGLIGGGLLALLLPLAVWLFHQLEYAPPRATHLSDARWLRQAAVGLIAGLACALLLP